MRATPIDPVINKVAKSGSPDNIDEKKGRNGKSDAVPGFDGGMSLPLDAAISLILPRSLQLFSSVFPVD